MNEYLRPLLNQFSNLILYIEALARALELTLETSS